MFVKYVNTQKQITQNQVELCFLHSVLYIRVKMLCNQQLVISVLLLPGHGEKVHVTWLKTHTHTPSDSCHLIVSATQSEDQDMTGTFKPVEEKNNNKTHN